jgi:hypothetical protein
MQALADRLAMQQLARAGAAPEPLGAPAPVPQAMLGPATAAEPVAWPPVNLPPVPDIELALAEPAAEITNALAPQIETAPAHAPAPAPAPVVAPMITAASTPTVTAAATTVDIAIGDGYDRPADRIDIPFTRIEFPPRIKLPALPGAGMPSTLIDTRRLSDGGSAGPPALPPDASGWTPENTWHPAPPPPDGRRLQLIVGAGVLAALGLVTLFAFYRPSSTFAPSAAQRNTQPPPIAPMPPPKSAADAAANAALEAAAQLLATPPGSGQPAPAPRAAASASAAAATNSPSR